MTQFKTIDRNDQTIRSLDDAELDAVNGGVKIEPVYGPQSLKINVSHFAVNEPFDIGWVTAGAPPSPPA